MAGVSSDAVKITIEAASVRITAVITLNAGATSAPVMQALDDSFATPDAASTILGITVLGEISLELIDVNAPSPQLPSPPPPVSSKDENLTLPLWALLTLLPLCLLLVAALVLLYHRHMQLSRDRANAVLSRDRANFDLQISVHVNHKLQRAFREAQGNEGIDLVQREQTQADDTASLSSSVPSRWLSSLGNGKGPPSTLPPGPPSSAATPPSSMRQSVVEQEMVVSAPTPPPPDTNAMPAAPTPPAPGHNWVPPWCGASKKAPRKRPAPPGPASAPRAKKAYAKSYHEFCRAAWSKCLLGSAPARTPVPPQGALGGSGQLSTPKKKSAHCSAQPLPQVLELAASKAAHSPAFDHIQAGSSGRFCRLT